MTLAAIKFIINEGGIPRVCERVRESEGERGGKGGQSVHVGRDVAYKIVLLSRTDENSRLSSLSVFTSTFASCIS